MYKWFNEAMDFLGAGAPACTSLLFLLLLMFTPYSINVDVVCCCVYCCLLLFVDVCNVVLKRD